VRFIPVIRNGGRTNLRNQLHSKLSEYRQQVLTESAGAGYAKQRSEH
jgi:hypothetical protein